MKSIQDLQKIQRSYADLSTALATLRKLRPEQSTIDQAIKRGYFLPEEDDYLWSLISRYLTIRRGFWLIINKMSTCFLDELKNIKTLDDWRYFLLGYASSCQVVSMASLLVDEIAKHKLVQRKINEGAPQLRIPRKTFTHIFQSLSDIDNAIKMRYMKNYVADNRQFIQTLNKDNYVGNIVENLEKLEQRLNKNQLSFLKLRLRYLWHSISRRGAVSKQKTSFFILEKAGRVIAKIGIHEKPRVTSEIRKQIENILKPGDVIITRHDLVASNIFLPGYWPHAALYIGTESMRTEIGVTIGNDMAKRWSGEIGVLEAKSDGVLFRALTETLDVDECIVIRPQLSEEQIAKGIKRAVQHEGKGYNFDFDFFRSDQLVCTEVVFRAYDGVGEIKFNLIERAGRLSLSAEDLLDMAIDQKGFKIIAIFGVDGSRKQLIVGDDASKLAFSSYKGL